MICKHRYTNYITISGEKGKPIKIITDLICMKCGKIKKVKT